MKRIFKFLKNEPVALYYIVFASGLIVPVVVFVAAFVLRGAL